MDDKISIRKFLELPLEEQVGNGLEFKDGGTCGVWYDWFCTNKSLPRRGKALVSKLKAIAGSGKFDLDKNYVWFKNNCPMFGSLYDDFRISDIETGEVLFTVAPKEGYSNSNGMGSVWGRNPDGTFSEQFRGTWKEIKIWFNGEKK